MTEAEQIAMLHRLVLSLAEKLWICSLKLSELSEKPDVRGK